MEPWLLIISTLCISAFLKGLYNILFPNKKHGPMLPPGPPSLPFIGSTIWLRKSLAELESVLRSIHSKFGNVVTLQIGSHPTIFVRDHSIAYQALVRKAVVFADRHPTLSLKINCSNEPVIGTAVYGSNWRILRKNLSYEILSPPRVRSYAHARKWVLTMLKERLMNSHSSGEPVEVRDHFKYSSFSLLSLMCFGDKLDEKQIKRIEGVQRDLLLNLPNFDKLDTWPRVSKILFHRLWKKFYQIRQNQEDVLIPIIRARKEAKQEYLMKVKEGKQNKEENKFILSYADTLLDVQLPEEKRRLTEGEIVCLCIEFLNAGTATSSTTMEWIMANLVKYPHIQQKLFMEIKRVVGEGEEEVKEDDLSKIPYVKAVVLEGLRRHSPGDFLLPRRVTRDIVLNDFLLPKDCTINFLVAEMGLDPTVWEDPMAFKPERFLNSDVSEVNFDINCSREMKMMPFGAGRRICPAVDLAMLHMEYLLANLVWSFAWKAVDGDDVDLSPKQEFTKVMKTPLQVRLCSRRT